ncbi:hypothetical protein ACROYT_G039837 [Oculina patagonica]
MSTKALIKRAQYQKTLIYAIWTRWKTEYLTSLREHHTCRKRIVNKKTVAIGDVVLIHDSTPRNQWKIGVVTSLHTGKDGLARSVSLRVPSGKELSRPVEKLYPLEMSDIPTNKNIEKAPENDIQLGAVITRKPSSVIIEGGQNVSLVCQATGQPTPTVTWRKWYNNAMKKRFKVEKDKMVILSVTKADGEDYVCSAKNLLNEDSAVAQITVIEELKFKLLPPVKLVVLSSSDVILNCTAQGASEIFWKRSDTSHLPNHIMYPNGTLVVKRVTSNHAGTYTCVARNFHRSIKANALIKVLPKSCSNFKTSRSGSSSGNYMIDPDGKGGVIPFSVYCDMNDKSSVGVTIISHDSESRTHVGPNGCSGRGCYSKDVRYTGVSTAQLAALTRVSQNCEQFIKFECNNDVTFIEHSYAWWVSRDGTQMNYWGGATGHDKMCACGVTNSCTGGKKCNCHNYASGWREDSGLLTDKSALPVTQIRLGDLDGSKEEGYHTLGKLKCYGQA